MDKEFVLVSQGIEIMRTKSQEEAINYVKEQNDKYFKYKQRCANNYEPCADNYIDLEIEYPEDIKLKQRLDKALQLSNEGLTEDYLNSVEDEFFSDYNPLARDIAEAIHKKYGDILRGEDK